MTAISVYSPGGPGTASDGYRARDDSPPPAIPTQRTTTTKESKR